MISRTKFLWWFLLAGIGGKLLGFDAAQFYHTPLMQLQPRVVPASMTTDISVRASVGRASESFAAHGTRAALFNAHGFFDLARLGVNVQDPKTRTTDLWVTPGVGKFGAAGTDIPLPSSNDGKFEVNGKLSLTQVDFELKQTLWHGFYAQVYAPIKQFKLGSIEFKNKGVGILGTVPMDTFVTAPANLPAILSENGFKPLNTAKRNMSFGDPVVSVGWEGYASELSALVSNVAGYLQAGVSLPAAPRKNPDRVFDLPLGYDGHIGFVGRGSIEACLFKAITLGAVVGSTVFLRDAKSMRLKTDKDQSGWLLLQKARVKEDLGSLWDLGAYISTGSALKGFRATMGYTFVTQERTRLHVTDGNYLKDFIALKADPLRTNPPVFISQDDYANSDARLQSWQTQVVHAALALNTREAFNTKYGMLAQIEYDYPIAGKYSWVTGVFAGTVGASLSFNF